MQATTEKSKQESKALKQFWWIQLKSKPYKSKCNSKENWALYLKQNNNKNNKNTVKAFFFLGWIKIVYCNT